MKNNYLILRKMILGMVVILNMLLLLMIHKSLGQATAINPPYVFIIITVLSSFIGALIIFKSTWISPKFLRIIGYFVFGYIIGVIVLTIQLFWITLVFHPYFLYADNIQYQEWHNEYAYRHIIVHLKLLYFRLSPLLYLFWFICGNIGIALEIIFKDQRSK